MKPNVLTQTDAYKLSHEKFQHDGAEFIYSNMTPRGSKYLPVMKEFYDNKSVFFGLQYFIKSVLVDEWNQTFFSQPKEKVIAKFKRRLDNFLGKDSICVKRFEDLHDLGYLPIKIKALPEGARVNEKVPYFTVINTDKRFAWLTNYLETIISCETWKPCVSATVTYELRKMINRFAMETVGHLEGTQYQIHGFEFRGMSGRYDAAITGSGLLLNSWGTDTIPAIDLLEDYYNADSDKESIAFSVPASEHSVSSLGSAIESELEFFRKAITQNYPTGIVSLVADTYDFFRVMTEYTVALKDDILNRKPNELGLAKVVWRPDSGNPVKIVCGDPNAPFGSPEYKGAVECLWDVFGGTVSKKGFKVLNERTGLIYGDGMTQKVMFEILTGLKSKGFASNNIVFGCGSYLLNLTSRDCLSLAIKATWAQVNGVGYDLFKDPKTDDGMKKSAKGLLRVDLVDGEYILKDQCTPEEEAGGELQTVFENGQIIKEWSLSEIRARINQSIQ